MSLVKYEEQILDAIDQLRRRKARPDAERIYNTLLRRHGINFNEAKVALENCISAGVVLKVSYKGNISYRNAAKKFPFLRRDSQGELVANGHHHHHHHHHHNGSGGNGKQSSRKFTGLLTTAFTQLVLQEPDYLQLGIPKEELIKNILSKDSVKYTKNYVNILLEKEVENGSLIRMPNGHFHVVRTKSEHHHNQHHKRLSSASLHGDSNGDEYALDGSKDDKSDGYGSVTEHHHKMKKKPGPKPGMKRDRSIEGSYLEERKADNNNALLRVGGRRKRAKKVFDPSDNNLPKKRGRPIGSLNRTTIEKHMARISDSDSRPDSRASLNGKEHGGVCSVCHLQNKKGPNDRMIACRECSNKAHLSCLNGEDMMLKMSPDNTWQCPHCKTCVVCYETADAGNLIVCFVCADAYHISCHQPKITDKIRNGSKWLCINCQMPDQLAVNNIQLGFSNVETTDKLNDDSPSPCNSGNSSPYRSSASPTPPTLSPQTLSNKRKSPSFSDVKSNHSDSQSIKDLDLEEQIDPTIPDATNWTFDDVYNYFAQYFPEEAKVFKEQEIDGHSLLLMKRMDVLTSLKLKLGPALKIYRHVVKLQVRRDDPKLYWL